MAYKTSELPRITPTTGALIEIVENGNTRATTVKALSEAFLSSSVSKNVSGDFAVSGSQTITGNLTVQRNTYLGDSYDDIICLIGSNRISGDILHSGRLTSTGDTVLRGTTYLGGLGKQTNISGNTNITGSLIVNEYVGVARDLSISGNLFVTGGVKFLNKFSGYHLFVDKITAIDAINFGGTVTVTNDFTANSVTTDTLVSTGPVELGSTETESSLYGTLNTNHIRNSGNLYVSGDSCFSGVVQHQGITHLGTGALNHTFCYGRLYAKTGLYSDGEGYFKQNVTITGGVYVSGNSVFTGQVGVAGKIRGRGGMEILGHSSVSDNLFVGNNTYNTGSVYIGGDLKVTGEITFDGVKWVKFDGQRKELDTLNYVGTTATATMDSSEAYLIDVGDIIFVTGINLGAASNESFYLGQFTVTSKTLTSVSYTMPGIPTANYGNNDGRIDTVIKNAKGVASVKRNYTGPLAPLEGDFTVTFTNPFSSNDYFCSVTAKSSAGGSSRFGEVSRKDMELSTEKRILIEDALGAPQDSSGVYFMAML